MNHPRNYKLTVLLLSGLLLLVLPGCFGRSYQYQTNKVLRFESLQPGMTKDAVRGVLGEPSGVERRMMSPDELREVWVYHVQNPDLRNHLYPNLHLIVFSNDTMMAQNPDDPYAPLPQRTAAPAPPPDAPAAN
jgi:hypothetical protein